MPWIVPIPGTTKISHMEQNVESASVTLSAEDVKELDDGLTRVDGARTTAAILEQTDIGAKLGTSSKGGHGMSPLPEDK